MISRIVALSEDVVELVVNGPVNFHIQIQDEELLLFDGSDQKLVIVDQARDHVEVGVESDDLLEHDPVSLAFVCQLVLVDGLLLIIVLNQTKHSSTTTSSDRPDSVDLSASHGRRSITLDDSELQRTLLKLICFQILSVIKRNALRLLT